MVIDELIAVLGFQVEGESNLRKFTSALDQAEKKSQAFARAIGNTALVVGGAIISSMSALTAGVVATGAQFEQLEVRLEALEGSAEKGRTALEWVREFAEATPLSLSQTADAYARLRTFGIDPTNGSLMAAVDTMAMAGQGADYLNGIVLAMGQAWTKQKLQGEEALQLIERGVPVWDLLSESMGVSVEQVQELSKKGKLGRKEMQLLFDAMGKRALGASEKMAKTWTGLLGRLGDKWEGFLKMIADGGVFDEMKATLEGVMETLELWSKDGSMQRIADTLSKAMIEGVRYIRIFVERVTTHLKFLFTYFDRFKQYSNVIGLAILALVAYSRPFITAITLMALAIDDLLTYMQGGQSVFGRFVNWLKELLGIPERAAAEIAGLSAVIGAVLIPTILRAIPRVGGALVFGLLRVLSGPVGWGLIAAELIASMMGIDLYDVGVKIVQSLIAGMVSLRGHIRSVVDSIFGEGHADEMQKIVDATPTSGTVQKPAGSWWEWFGGKGADAVSNMNGNVGKISSSGLATVAPSTVNDSRDQSQTVTVNVGGVTVQGVQNVTPAVGAAVGAAVGSAATPSRIVNPGSSF